MNAVAPEERPVITAVEIEGTSQVKISVTHTKVIEKVAYRWDDLESTTQKAKNNENYTWFDDIISHYIYSSNVRPCSKQYYSSRKQHCISIYK